jgi:hypothetical protein
MALKLTRLAQASAPRPPTITVFGVAGIGKTSFAAAALNPVFLLTEDGLGMREVAHFPLAKAYDDCIGHLAALYSEEHDFSTVVVDSLDWLEPLIHARVCRDNGWSSIEEPGYGKGYVAALALWRQYLDGLNALRDERGMTVVQIAHSEIRRFDSPEHEPYDRYGLKLHARAAALVLEHSDAALFANFRVATVKSDVGFNKRVNRAVGSGERLIHTTERPAFIAKNRYGLPDTLPLDWDSFARAMPEALQPMLITSEHLQNLT